MNGPDVPRTTSSGARRWARRLLLRFWNLGSSRPPWIQRPRQSVVRSVEHTKNPLEAAAIDDHRYDTAIGLLESRRIGGRASVRAALADVLTPDGTINRRHTSTHLALLTLSTTRTNCVRLVTTNYDRLFEKVIEDEDLGVRRFQGPVSYGAQRPMGWDCLPPWPASERQ